MTSPKFDLGDIFSPELDERAVDQIAAVKGIIEVAGVIGGKHGTEHGIWSLMASLAIAARSVNLTPRQCSASMAVVRKRVDLIVDKLGEENVDVEAIVTELHLA